VARPKCSADMECDTFLETGMHRCRILDRLICEGGISECIATLECATFLVHAMESQEEIGHPKRAKWRIRSASRILESILIKVARWECNDSM
jgi:hypothetical protein